MNFTTFSVITASIVVAVALLDLYVCLVFNVVHVVFWVFVPVDIVVADSVSKIAVIVHIVIYITIFGCFMVNFVRFVLNGSYWGPKGLHIQSYDTAYVLQLWLSCSKPF